MSDKSLKHKSIYGLIWQLAEKFGSQIVGFVVSIALARILTPDDYGLVGLITVFINIALIFTQSGMGQALVQKKNADQKDYSTVFYYSLALSVIIYIILWFAAISIAKFYNDMRLAAMIRVLGLTVIIGAVISVQQAMLQREMNFRLLFTASLAGNIISGILGIAMAYMSFGVWALVAQQLSNQFINMLMLWVMLKFKINTGFSFSRMKLLFGYSWKLLFSTLVDGVYNNIHSLIIGKYYSAADLGYYNRGKQFPVLIVQNSNAAINGVLFPVLSKLQDDKTAMKAAVRRSMSISTYIVFPLMAGLAAVAEPMIRLLLTEKWLPAVPFLRFCCFTYGFWPIHTANLQAIKALGRSDTFLKLEIIKKIIGVTILIVTIPHGLMAIMWGKCITTVLSSIINAIPNNRLIGYKFTEQIRDIFPAFIMSCMIPAAILPMQNIILPDALLIAIEIIVGAAVYIGLSIIFKSKSFNYLVKTLKEMKGGNVA